MSTVATPVQTGPGLEVLSQGVGYGIIAGIGVIFTLIMMLTTYIQNRYTSHSTRQSEEFNTASRSVKPGMIAAGVVSSWTWSATLLTSCTIAYLYGISGGMWYAAMGSSQVLLFSLLSLSIKRNTPGAHTFPEIVLSRHGKIAHAVYLFFGWATNMLVSACLVLGGSQVVGALSGISVYAACFIIPICVAAYVIQGGLRSTFVADYIHTVVLFIAIFIFSFTIYATDMGVGSIGKFYDLLVEASIENPVAGNAGGSFLAFQSTGALIFAASIFSSGFSMVWLDQAYFQRAIASRPESSVTAYVTGSIAWYGIPFVFSTAMGLGGIVMKNSPRFPTFPNPLSQTEVSEGFSGPATTVALMGSGGAALMIILLLMAVTSATSAELIAVSSLWTFDVYKLYINPSATSSHLVRVSHLSIGVYALVVAGFCCVLNYAGIGTTYILTTCGIIVGGGGIPLGLILLWPSRMSTIAAIISPMVALPIGVTCWMVTTHLRSGSFTVTTTGDSLNIIAGSIASPVSGALFAVVLSFIFPRKFSSTNLAHLTRCAKINGVAPVALKEREAPSTATEIETDGSLAENPAEKSTKKPEKFAEDSSSSPSLTGNDVVDFLNTNHIEPLDLVLYEKARKLAIVPV
ncbi:hypothetical protein V500_05454 [Pseudogymnoascus sp. VKM F-4518 (FW-2643)]|nr:hypothetical protein V500_05454 [Pseudogymnoascus sp. VKM F-4518 (FW-2643)]